MVLPPVLSRFRYSLMSIHGIPGNKPITRAGACRVPEAFAQENSFNSFCHSILKAMVCRNGLGAREKGRCSFLVLDRVSRNSEPAGKEGKRKLTLTTRSKR